LDVREHDHTERNGVHHKGKTTVKNASDIKLAYLTFDISYETALTRLGKLGYGASAADDFLFTRVADIKNGDVTEGPALLTNILNRR